MSDDGGLLTVWADALLGALADAGVTDVVISPGSRSTPFVLAAARETRLRCHDLIDERSAAFFALGQARVTGRPALLLCTSGTAGAHYYPAVIEAGLAYVPLIVVTADRPFELMDCGAPQTIDQTRLYGAHARAFVELGLPDGSAGALRALRRAAAQAVLTSRWPLPGAVHLNARARKPLEPRPPGVELAAVAAAVRAEAITRATPPRIVAEVDAVEAVARACRRARRGLIVAGPAPLGQAGARPAVAALAAATGFPVLADAASQLRSGDACCHGYETFLRTERFLRGEGPGLVLQLGAPLTSSGWAAYLAAHPDVSRHVIAAYGWNDPSSAAASLLVGDVGETVAALAAAIGREGPPEPSGWAARFAAAGAAVRRVLDGELAGEQLTEGEVAHSVAAASGAVGGLLVVGNSLPIRTVDAFCPDAADVLSQRGANGIDGLISGAAGAASAAGGRPVTLLVGDVSFLHDLGGLAAAARQRALVIVVVHNDGGRIFEQLPLAGAAAAAQMEHFTTPHGRELGHAARLFGLAHARVAARGDLRRALADSHATGGAWVIEAMVPPHGAAEQQARILAEVEALP